MRTFYRRVVVTSAVAFSAVLLLAPASAFGQATALARTPTSDTAEAARAKRIAQRFERDARVLTVFDRQGTVVTTVGERAIYFQPVFSPDRTRLAVERQI